MATDAPAIAVQSLYKSYESLEAVRGISFEVRYGEVFGLLGPNGAGKTTTVEILEGYRKRSSGEIKVLGYDPSLRPPELRANVGIVLQSCGIYSYITVREALTHWASFYPHPRDVEETLELAGLREVAQRRTRQLSGGQLRRLDFGLALIGDPKLIFLDEPTTGFDPAARHQAWETIKRLKQLGKTVLLTTHYLEEAQALADRVAIIQNGRIVATGPPQELGSDHDYRVSYRTSVGELVMQQTSNPTALLYKLTSDALSRNEELKDLSINRPSLEDVYLELTKEPKVNS